MTTMIEIVYAVRAVMVDGSYIDILLFGDERDAEEHADSVRSNCRLLGFDRISVVPRRVIGKMVDRRSVQREANS